jgi:hypothetical protein
MTMDKEDVLEIKARLLRVAIEGLFRISQEGLGVDEEEFRAVIELASDLEQMLTIKEAA